MLGHSELLSIHQRGLGTRGLVGHQDQVPLPTARASLTGVGRAERACYLPGHSGQRKVSHTHLHKLPLWLALLGLQFPNQFIEMGDVPGHSGAVRLPDLTNGLAQLFHPGHKMLFLLLQQPAQLFQLVPASLPLGFSLFLGNKGQDGLGVCTVGRRMMESPEAHLLEEGKRQASSASWRLNLEPLGASGLQSRRQNGPEPSRTD